MKISICIVSMNRLHHLKRTLRQNIEDSLMYENVEIVILDYNSSDGLAEWINLEFSEYIEANKMFFYRTTDPVKWNPSHSKNMAFKLASGDILCNIWADYYIGKGFIEFILSSFLLNFNIVITPIDFHRTKPNFSPPPDVLGKVCVRKEHFMRVKGFDERISQHGFEDYDFINRLEFLGLARIIIDIPEFLKFLPHDDSERFKLPDLKDLFVRHIDPSRSELLLLYVNNTYEHTTIVDSYRENADQYWNSYKKEVSFFQFKIEKGFTVGKWRAENETIILKQDHKNKQELLIRQNNVLQGCSEDNKKYFRITDQSLVQDILKFRHFWQTRNVMENNLTDRRIKVNPNGFGKGSVTRNSSAITISI